MQNAQSLLDKMSKNITNLKYSKKRQTKTSQAKPSQAKPSQAKHAEQESQPK